MCIPGIAVFVWIVLAAELPECSDQRKAIKMRDDADEEYG
jgi:hypothetical protein